MQVCRNQCTVHTSVCFLRWREIGELTQHKSRRMALRRGKQGLLYLCQSFYFENIETILSTVVIKHMCYVNYILQVASLMHSILIVPAPCPNQLGLHGLSLHNICFNQVSQRGTSMQPVQRSKEKARIGFLAIDYSQLRHPYRDNIDNR